MKSIAAIIALSTLPLIPLSAHAQFAKIEDAVKYRKAVFQVMGNHMGRVGAVVKGQRPYDKASLEADVTVIEMMSKLPWQAFPPDSNIEGSTARLEIWKNKEEFEAAAEKMQAEVSKLSAAARAGDLASIKTSFGNVGQSCKSCHDDFRRK
jgi:cytochrome c556